MLSDKDLGIKKLILDRIMQIDDEIVQSDPEYKKLEERPNELLRLIAAKLTPEDNELLMNEYDNSYFDPICRREELIYSEALIEGNNFWVLGGVSSTGSRKNKSVKSGGGVGKLKDRVKKL
jgi:hypothetical protein